jgi:ribonuclease HII
MSARDPEPRRLQNSLEYEDGFWSRGVSRLAGVDEVGRGPLAGPVVAAAVILPRDIMVEGATDSKKLTAIRRESLCRAILDMAMAVGVGAASVREIDRDGIAPSTARAVSRALDALPLVPDHVVVDGLPMRRLAREHDAVVKGDERVHCIACASIVAKVYRDRLMRRLHPRYPAYGWMTNVGYGTKVHMEALRRFGPSPHHRKSFAGVQMELGLESSGPAT